MIAMNLSHETFVDDPAYLGLPGVAYETIEYDNYQYLKLGKGDVLTKIINEAEPVKRSIFVQPPRDDSGNIIEASRGVIPRILQQLLSARKATKKKMALEQDPFRKGLYNAMQNAYKVVSNSVYGQTGASTSACCLKEIAASTTSVGRRSLLFARDYIMQTYGAVPVYGDSVAAYTPLVIRTETGGVHMMSIDSLVDFCRGTWVERPDGKYVCDLGDVSVWSDDGWTAIQQVVRHRLSETKKLVRVCTEAGIVDVTDDHSLLRLSKEKVSPKDIRIGDPLLHHPIPPSIVSELAEQETHRLNDNYAESYQLFKVQDSKGQLRCARHVCLAKSLGLSVSMRALGDDDVLLTTARSLKPTDSLAVNTVYELSRRTDFVYDLTTSNHHFAAGIGDLIVHNTDSVFMRFDCRHTDGSKMRGLDAVRESMRLSLKASQEVTDRLPAPNCLAFEKVIYPFLLLSKKRYVGGYYEEMDQTKPKIKHMGVVLKRRDNAPIVKHFYAGVVDILLRQIDTAEFQEYIRCNPDVDERTALIRRAQRFITAETQKLLDAKFPVDKFILSKSLRAEYKNPDSIAHRTLADRANERGTDNFQSNDRVAYVHVITKTVKGQKLLQGEKIETPQFAAENKLKLNYKHYLTNGIEKPVSQIFGLAVEALEGYDSKKHSEVWRDIQDPKRKEEKRMKVAAEILFNNMVVAYENKLNRVRTLTEIWKK